MAKLEELEIEVVKIKERNARVEADKSWETSFFRRGILAVGIYVFSTLFLLVISAQNPFLAALVPAAGFLLSTLTIPFLKSWWVAHRNL